MLLHQAVVRLCALTLASAAAHAAVADRVVEIFNGTNLSGWTKLGGAATYSVENNEIVGRSAPNTSNTFLATNQDFANFILELDFWISDPTFNSGIQLRSDSLPQHNSGRVFGYQVEIDPSSRAWSAGLYFEGGSPNRPAGWLDDLSDNQAAREAFRLGEWNHVRISAQGRRFQTWLNGVPAVDYTDTSSQAFLPTGFIALQVHEVGGATVPKEVRWRNLVLQVIDQPITVPGDVNNSGTADFVDYEIIRSHLHRTGAFPAEGDLNNDGVVNFLDFRRWKDALASGGAEGASIAVPEPAAIALALLAAIGASRQFRRPQCPI